MNLKNTMSKQYFSSIILNISAVVTVLTLMSNIVSSDLPDHQEDFKQITKIAEDIDKMFPNSQVYSVGQSLGWIIEAIKMMNTFRPTRSTFQHIPFSKSFLTDGESDSESDEDAYFRTPGIFTYKSRDMPTDEEQNNYRLFLQSHGLDPENILSRYENSGRQTVILDYINSGCGIASFLYFLRKWAKEKNVDLTNALRVVVLTDMWSSTIQSLDINDSEYVIDLTVMNRDEPILNKLVNTEEEKSDFVRLVPVYSHDLWNDQPKENDQEHKQRIDKMMEKMRQYVEEYFATLAVSTTTAAPTTVLRTPMYEVELPPIDFEIPSTSFGSYGSCYTPEYRFKRQLRTGADEMNVLRDNPFYLIFTLHTRGYLNRRIYNILKKECTWCSNDTMFIKFIKEELKNPRSTASRILEQACKKKTETADSCDFYQAEENYETDTFFNEVMNMILYQECA